MRCPACLELMECYSEIHKISSTKNRMDLHCFNDKCPVGILGKSSGLYFGQFVTVITEDPLPWECIGYGLVTVKNDRRILLHGEFGKSTYIKIDNNHQRRWNFIYMMPYVQLSTGDDMHLQVIQLTERYSKLMAFA